jgi:hypothetical protein
MPNATELCALTDIKTLLGITSSGQDALLQIIKDSVEQYVKTRCGRDFLVASYTEYHDGDDFNVLRVLQRPIVSIDSIYSDPARLFTDASLIPSSDIIDDPRSKTLGFVELLTYKFLKGIKATKITYSAGYATIPSDLSMAVKLIVCKQYKVADKKLFAEGTQTTGQLTITLAPDAFPKDALDVIDRYRRIDF